MQPRRVYQSIEKGGVYVTHGAKVKGLLFDLVRLPYFLFE
jgi:hypothetical protein